MPSHQAPKQEVLRTEGSLQGHSHRGQTFLFGEQRLKVHENGPWLTDFTSPRIAQEVTYQHTAAPCPPAPQGPRADSSGTQRPACLRAGNCCTSHARTPSCAAEADFQAAVSLMSSAPFPALPPSRCLLWVFPEEHSLGEALTLSQLKTKGI